jgi:hypothetical protein
MTATDLITLFLSILCLIRGASRGFMNSLIVPFSLIVATIISIVYYQYTKNLIVSLALGCIGPFLLGLFLKFLLQRWAEVTNTAIKPNFLSRLTGAILTLVWGWVFIIITLILLAVVPSWGEMLTAVHNDVVKSKSYGSIAKPFEVVLFPPLKQNTATVTSANPNADAKSLAQDPRFQKIMQDPEIQKEIEEHDMVKLMSNPEMMALTQEIMNDPATMKKVMALYRSQTQPPAK